MLRRIVVVRTDVSEELSASFIRATRICELGTTLAVTNNRRSVQRNISEDDILRNHYSENLKSQIDGDDCGEISGMSEWQGKPKYWEETCPSDAVADQHMT
jgi:hypothetical protein